MTEEGKKLLELYRLLRGLSRLRPDGRLEVEITRAKLAEKLRVSEATVKRRLSDIRTPDPDPRHPKANTAGRRLGWIGFELERAEDGPHKGEYVGQRFVILVDEDEAFISAGHIDEPRPKPQVRAKGHAAETAKPQVRAKGHEGAEANVQVRAKGHAGEPRVTPEPRVTQKEPVSPGQSQGSSSAVTLQLLEALSLEQGGELEGLGFPDPGGADLFDSTAEADEPALMAGLSAVIAEASAWESMEDPQAEVEEPPAFPSMAAEKAWVSLRRRRKAAASAGEDAESRADPVRLAMVRRRNGDGTWVLWVGHEDDGEEGADVGYQLDPDMGEAFRALRDGGLLEGANLLVRDGPVRGSALSEYYRVTPPRDEEVTG